MPTRFVRCREAVLLRPLGPHTWLGRLPNGHELALLLPRAGAGVPAWPAAGDRVVVDISPADFSHGQIQPTAKAPVAHETPGGIAHDL